MIKKKEQLRAQEILDNDEALDSIPERYQTYDSEMSMTDEEKRQEIAEQIRDNYEAHGSILRTYQTHDSDMEREMVRALELKEKDQIEDKIIGEHIDKLNAEEKAKLKAEKQREIQERALEILENEDPIDYIMKGHQKLHVGDYGLAKLLLLSIGVQSTKTGSGIQVSISGISGKGKTHCCLAMMHLMPKEYVINARFSDKELYRRDLKAGTVILIDDAKLSPDFDNTMRKAITQFQTETPYETLVGGKPKTFVISPRIVWWLTSVKEKYSEELLNRMFKIGVDETLDQDDEVHRRQQERVAKGSVEFGVTKRVRVSREIIKKIKSEKLFKVIIPYASDIEMGDKRNRRYTGMFNDTIMGFAVFRYKHRAINEKGKLIAKIEDYDDAAKFFNKYGMLQSSDFTKEEILVGNILNNLNTALTREEVAEKINVHPNSAGKYLKGLEIKLDDESIFRKFKVHSNPGKGGRAKFKYKTVNFDALELSENKISMDPKKREEWLSKEEDLVK